ncbi:MAG: cytosolic protein [Clostridiaceae bacterium]|nr:cytosolic protein [Clostridiaceae bacterium]
MRENKRSRFSIENAEKFVIEKIGGHSSYSQAGGYHCFYSAVKSLEQDGVISPVKSSGFNGINPALHTRWKLVDECRQLWDVSFIMQLSDRLDMSGYLKNPKWHTPKEKQYILSIYEFLKSADKREYASCEERCLELFGNEKFLQTGDKKVISRLNLTYDQLKMIKYGQMFTYWIRKRGNTRKVIILENHSTFFSIKRWVESGGSVFGMEPDLIIFGDGKHIIKSLSFLNEIAPAKKCVIEYFGDIDPEGFVIYNSLKKKYSDLNISMFLPAYRFLLETGKSFDMGKSQQNMNPKVLEEVTSEFMRFSPEYANKIRDLWYSGKRIPQEFLTYEALKHLSDNE